MADVTVYIGDDARFDFKAEEVATSGVVVVPLPLGTKLYSGVKLALTNVADPPLITKRNLAAGGDEQQARVTSDSAGLFSVYLQETDTGSLADGKKYQIDGQVELADGTHWTAGICTFTAKNRVWRTPS